MCGIIGYIGKDQAVPVLLKGLERLEYRGYDSAGIAVCDGSDIKVDKAKGRLAVLRERIAGREPEGTLGIGHTRWATHGEPSDINSHPHTDVKGEIAIVHNGIIENYLTLKQWLIEQGVLFVSDTDTEVVAHLLNHYYKGDMFETIYKVLPLLQGSFALGIIAKSEPDKLYCARNDSPLVVGHTAAGNYIASDIPAILEYCRDVYLLDNYEVAVLTREKIEIFDRFGGQVKKDILHVDWDVKTAEKAGFAHFMLKEIHDEPSSLRDTLKPHLAKDGKSFAADTMPFSADEVKAFRHITILACGTAYHAGIVAKNLFERLARIPVEVDIASEYRYRDAVVGEGECAIIISQSGETADTIGAMREAKRRGARILAITNVVGSTISREADSVLYTWAGPEIAVASTKAYVSQLMMLYMLAIDFAHKIGRLDGATLAEYLAILASMPEKSEKIISDMAKIQRFAHAHFDRRSVFYIGRGLDYALAMEASLKLKEISYIHSEAYAAGELKHGTIALIEPGTLVVAMGTQESLGDKTASGIQEVAVRGAVVLGIAMEGNTEMEKVCTEVWKIPRVPEMFAPLLAMTPMQIFAYYTALEKGCDIDKPRNLAKSVTVE